MIQNYILVANVSLINFYNGHAMTAELSCTSIDIHHRFTVATSQRPIYSQSQCVSHVLRPYERRLYALVCEGFTIQWLLTTNLWKYNQYGAVIDVSKEISATAALLTPWIHSMIPSLSGNIKRVAVSAPESPLTSRLYSAYVRLLGLGFNLDNVYSALNERARHVQNQCSCRLNEVDE